MKILSYDLSYAGLLAWTLLCAMLTAAITSCRGYALIMAMNLLGAGGLTRMKLMKESLSRRPLYEYTLPWLTNLSVGNAYCTTTTPCHLSTMSRTFSLIGTRPYPAPSVACSCLVHGPSQLLHMNTR
jgi:hypothetical protein